MLRFGAALRVCAGLSRARVGWEIAHRVRFLVCRVLLLAGDGHRGRSELRKHSRFIFGFETVFCYNTNKCSIKWLNISNPSGDSLM